MSINKEEITQDQNLKITSFRNRHLLVRDAIFRNSRTLLGPKSLLYLWRYLAYLTCCYDICDVIATSKWLITRTPARVLIVPRFNVHHHHHLANAAGLPLWSKPTISARAMATTKISVPRSAAAIGTILSEQMGIPDVGKVLGTPKNFYKPVGGINVLQ